MQESDKSICITEGEFDAMAVHQKLNIPTVSLPNGTNHLPVSLLPFFERFEIIYIWLDADEPGRAAAQKFARKLGPNRCLLIDGRRLDENGPKDANEALKNDTCFKTLFSQAKTVNDQNVLRVSDIKEQILFRIRNEKQLANGRSTT